MPDKTTTLPEGWVWVACPRCGHVYAEPATSVQQCCVRCGLFYVDKKEDDDAGI
jgi:predicted  nucleic acid-binding Zn-ribbon protein